MKNWQTKKYEEHVLLRYRQLAGLVRDGQMVNRDKESRARQWVAEQEKLKKDKKLEWHKSWWWQVLLVIIGGAVATIIASLLLGSIL